MHSRFFKSLTATVLAFVLLLSAPASFSCKKKDTICHAVIIVASGSGASISGRKVHIWANVAPPGQIQQTVSTDATGRAYADFDLQAIFNVDVYEAGGGQTTVEGTGIIKLEPGEIVEKNISVP